MNFSDLFLIVYVEEFMPSIEKCLSSTMQNALKLNDQVFRVLNQYARNVNYICADMQAMCDRTESRDQQRCFSTNYS